MQEKKPPLYGSLEEWELNAPKAYYAANNRGLLPKIIEMFGWKKDIFYDSKEGYFKIMRNENIVNRRGWALKYRLLEKIDGFKYHSAPWKVFNQTIKEFFDECYPIKIDNIDKDKMQINKEINKESYFEIIRSEKIYGSNGWQPIYKKIGERDGVKYSSTPWRLFNQTTKEFFNECYPEYINYNDKNGYFNLMRGENIINCKQWGRMYQKLRVRDGIGYYSCPWILFNQNVKEFFDECYPSRKFCIDKEGYFKIIREENINSSPEWINIYKSLKERGGIVYNSTPWRFFKQSPVEFFKECYSKNINKYRPKRVGYHKSRKSFYSDKKGYFILIRNEKINGADSWAPVYKKLKERDGLKYSSTPWKLFNQTTKEFFNECYPDNVVYDDKNGYFNIMLIENINSINEWVDKYKKLKERDGVGYHSSPCRLFNQTTKEFFDEYRKWIKENRA